MIGGHRPRMLVLSHTKGVASKMPAMERTRRRTSCLLQNNGQTLPGGKSLMDLGDTYTHLIALLDRHRVAYRLIDHAPEGRTEIVSLLRGNALSQAAKCIVLMVKIGKKVTRYVLAVVPGDTRVDLQAVKALLQGTY